jgi:hypothetical protein
MPYESYPGGVHYEDVKSLNMKSLKSLHVEDLDSKEVEMLMDLALQSTREEIGLNLIDLESLEPSILRHDFMKCVSRLVLSSCELYSVLSEQLLTRSRSGRTTHATEDHSSKNQRSGYTG